MEALSWSRYFSTVKKHGLPSARSAMGCPRFSDPSWKSGCTACSNKLTFSRAVSNIPPVCSQTAPTPCILHALSLFPSILMSLADHAPSSSVLCRRDVPVHSCLTAALPTCRSSLCPRSLAQLSSRGCQFYPPHSSPLRCPWVSMANRS